jgi:hypothetical protein
VVFTLSCRRGWVTVYDLEGCPFMEAVALDVERCLNTKEGGR